MLVAAVIAITILLVPVVYALVRAFSVTRQEIEFATPQNGVSAIYLDIREDSVRSLHILFADGSTAEVTQLGAPG